MISGSGSSNFGIAMSCIFSGSASTFFAFG
jgi:hypothetical protein